MAQAQELIFAIPKQTSAQENINVGLVPRLTSPFNLFLNLKQLIDPDSRFIYFFIYSMGKQKVILWGVYDKQDQSFHIDSACRYMTRQLSPITMQWIKSGYTYIGNSVVNRPLEILSKMVEGKASLGILNVEGPRMDYQEYIQKKYLLAMLKGNISDQEYLDKYQVFPKLPEDDYELAEYADDLERELKKYEKGINRSDITYRFERSIKETLEKIISRFEDTVSKGDISSERFEAALQECPDLKECNRDINESCSVYFYGNAELDLLYPEDTRVDLT